MQIKMGIAVHMQAGRDRGFGIVQIHYSSSCKPVAANDNIGGTVQVDRLILPFVFCLHRVTPSM